MTRMKKCVAAAAVAAALVGAPTMAYAVGGAQASASSAGDRASGAHVPGTGKSAVQRPRTQNSGATAASARVVAPGEHVQAAPGVELWLTKDGKHWTTPELPEGQFASVADGNIDLSQPGVWVHMEPVADFYFLSGIYNGNGEAATVKAVTDKGTIEGHVVHLPGQHWGAWYITSPLPDDDASQDFVHNVTVYNTAGHVLASFPLPQDETAP